MTQHITRRGFLKHTLCLGTALGSGLGHALWSPAQASAWQMDTGGFKALVQVSLGGGNDATNTVLPYDDVEYARYRELRGSLALPKSELLPLNSLSGHYALHPALGGMQTLFNEGLAAIVSNVGPMIRSDGSVGGTPKRSSHRNQTQFWHGVDPTRIGTDNAGWFDRLQDHEAQMEVVRNTQPVTFLGDDNSDLQNMALSLQTQSLAAPNLFEQEISQRILLANAEADGLAAALSRPEINDAVAALETPFPNTKIGRQLADIARALLARDWYGVSRLSFLAKQGGYDFHSRQLPRQQRLLSELDAAITAFTRAMQQWGLAQQVTLFTTSEFGRTTTSNGTGSAHGWGGHQFVVGADVDGGQLIGRLPEMVLGGPDMTADKGVLIPNQSVDQYSATLARWFGVSDTSLPMLFPHLSKFSSPHLSFMA